MTSITIYSPIGVAVNEAPIPITKDARVFRQLGGDYYVELSFSVDDTLALPKGSYISVTDPTTEREEKYALKRDASPEPISGVNGYKYVLKFYSRQHDMEACQIKWLAGGSKELSFRVTTSLMGFAQLIADNMNAYLGTTDWSFDEKLDDTDMREQSFNGVSCWDAINSIANLFGVEWWIDHGEQLTIRFGKCENGDVVTDIREGEIVNRFPAPKRGDDSNYGTRFYIFGGTQNVPENYRNGSADSTDSTTFHIAEKRICLCEYTYIGIRKDYIPYFDAIKNLPQAEIVEKTIILDDIFPKNETTIDKGYILEQKENIIEGETAQPVYYIKVDSKPTVLSTLGITFTSGALSGRSFGASYTELDGGKYIKVHHTTESSGGASLIAVPNDNLKPKTGDSYILTGVELEKSDELYDDPFEAAERKLWVKGTELASKYAHDTNVYDCATNPVYCAKEEVNLDLGAKVMLIGAHFGENGRLSRIQGYEKKLYNPYIATYNIGDNSIYSRTLQGYKIYSMPVLEAVATTERTNEGLKQQISSMQDNMGLVNIQHRLGVLEGKDKEGSEVTADDNSVPGAKKYAENVAAAQAQAKAQEAQGNAIGHCNAAVGKLETAVRNGLSGTKNFVIYAGVANSLSVDNDGVGVAITTQFKNVYSSSDSTLDNYITIYGSDADKYAGAIIAIGIEVGARVMTDEALVDGDVIMAVNGGWVKINDTAGGSSSGEISDEAFYDLYHALTGIEINKETSKTRAKLLTEMPVVTLTGKENSKYALEPNTIYFYLGSDSVSGRYKVPKLNLPASTLANANDTWIFRSNNTYLSFEKWYRQNGDLCWDQTPYVVPSGTASLEITVKWAGAFWIASLRYFPFINPEVPKEY